MAGSAPAILGFCFILCLVGSCSSNEELEQRSDTCGTILFAVGKHFTARAGAPPRCRWDSYESRARRLGKLYNVRLIAFSPNRRLYAVRRGQLYVGNMRSRRNQNWFRCSRRIGRRGWNQFKFLFFHPNRLLYAVTYSGQLYRGRPPTNQCQPWRRRIARKIGNRGWNYFEALFFDPKGILYAVTRDDRLVKRYPPSGANDRWLSSSTTIGRGGWRVLTHFIGFSPDGYLWAVNKRNGYIYRGRAPRSPCEKYMRKARWLGRSYNMYRLLAFTRGYIVQNVQNFQFFPESGQIVEQSTELLKKEIYDNQKGIDQLNRTFTLDQIMEEKSEFQLSTELELGGDATFADGIPYIPAGGKKVSINRSSPHYWNFTDTNERQITFSLHKSFPIKAGKQLQVVASVQKATVEVPYRAEVISDCGSVATIEGTWQGVTYYNLMVDQEEYDGGSHM
ncbi:uncharacterized protein LOC108719446 [Xenopus laevis]|uniref:Tachylectin 2 domain-containing protein n=2 Tax=Xenopus laevis TaxID=8355 RepID=A0A974I2U5_XENLA|nr:uncharacterized protein LOC108719446 [Xenopus laevis]OCT99121.1 hypothetical protein XELAEV_18004912mg [Xenopus laevis]